MSPRRGSTSSPVGPFTLAVAGLIGDAMRSQGVSGRQLADMIGRSHEYVNERVSRKAKAFSPEDLYAASNALGIDLAALVAEAERAARSVARAQKGLR